MRANVTNQWCTPKNSEPDLQVLEESALATAQATIQGAIEAAGISQSELARKMDRPRSFISRMLSGDHNLTIRTMSRAMLACGFEIEMGRRPICWGWVGDLTINQRDVPNGVPAEAGTLALAI